MVTNNMRVHVIGGFVARLARKWGWAGITIPSPWGISVFMWGMPTQPELLHEIAHCDQIRLMGKLRWVVTILWQYVTCGYKSSPLEMEARRVAGEE